MRQLSREEIKTLIDQAEAPCVSLFMPTHEAGPEIRQDPIRFKNLIREAEAQLVATGMRPELARQLLKPATELDRGDFWRHQSQGLALFIAPEFCRFYRLPLPLEELVVVAAQFHLKPLMPLLSENQQFYILTLNQKQIRLLAATPYGVGELELANVPQTLEEALQYDETAKTGQFRIGTSRGGTANPFQQPGSFHGQGSPDRDALYRDILQYFHQVDAALHEYLRDKHAPLVLAGLDYLLSLYHQANTYPHLLEAGISKNAESFTPEELRDQAWEIVQPYFAQAQQAAADLYRQLAGTGRASSEIKEIVSAADCGRVQLVFSPLGRHCWGRFDRTTREVQLHPEPEPGDEDLLDVAALHTFLNAGTVYVVAPAEIPGGQEVAATFRY